MLLTTLLSYLNKKSRCPLVLSLDGIIEPVISVVMERNHLSCPFI
jgi:hypothetical protein